MLISFMMQADVNCIYMLWMYKRMKQSMLLSLFSQVNKHLHIVDVFTTQPTKNIVSIK